MSQYTTMFSEMWVQEFAKKGGGHHSAHIHWNQHVSGFYFLKCSDKTSSNISRTKNRCKMYKIKNETRHKRCMAWSQNYFILRPKPGMLIIFQDI